ncbi:MAG: hypothetical protein EXR50_06075 [Dehalococcoidia bacterium]|nr:hypothetical protein [Dehalococcoidia bacterium]
MAAQKITAEQVEGWLRIWPKMLVELDENVERWDEMPDWEQVDFMLEWSQFVSFLENVLCPAYESDLMTKAQREQYKELLSKLRKAIPTIQQLDLTRPRVALEV